MRGKEEKEVQSPSSAKRSVGEGVIGRLVGKSLVNPLHPKPVDSHEVPEDLNE